MQQLSIDDKCLLEDLLGPKGFNHYLALLEGHQALRAI